MQVEMGRKPLFSKLQGLLHGGDYNPEQWLDRPDILEEDIRLMKAAHVNSATVGVFSWAALEPEEGAYRLDWLRAIMDRLYENGIYTILATPSGAQPAWLSAAYPETLRVREDGVRNRHGLRHSHCPSSPRFREKAGGIAARLAGALGAHPGLIAWHISNEFGGECFCDLCADRFRQYLRERYGGDIGKLNREWWTMFWSHTFSSFDQIEPPLRHGDRTIMGLNLDWKRFTTWNMTDYVRFEAALLRSHTPQIPVTTNFMTLFEGLDYHKMAPELDIVSWDSYPFWGNDAETLHATAMQNAFAHGVMRGLKRDRPFMMMESTPSHVNWHPFNRLKRPGVHRLAAFQAVACGSDTVQYFQWRKSRGSYEQHHGAVVGHSGSGETRVFRDVAEVGALLSRMSEVSGSVVSSGAAILFDWESRWALADAKGFGEHRHYAETCGAHYTALASLGIDADIVSPEEDLSRYRLVIAPMLYLLRPGVADRLRRFVEGGGHLVGTYLTGYVNENALCWLGGFPGDGLSGLFGLAVEEIDSLYPSERVSVECPGDPSETYRARDFCELAELRGAQAVGVYGSEFYRDMPALTVHGAGAGKAWYMAARLEDDCLAALYRRICGEAGIAVRAVPDGVEMHERTSGGYVYRFYLNWTDSVMPIDPPEGAENILAGDAEEARPELAPLGVALYRFAG